MGAPSVTLFVILLALAAAPFGCAASRPGKPPDPSRAARPAASGDAGRTAATVAAEGPAEEPEQGTPDGGVPAPSAEPDRTQPPWSQTPTPPIEPGQVVKDEVAGGRHWRIGTENGVVHVWRPPGYHGASAGIVIYLHGYYTNVDQAWEDHHLAEQFRDCHQNALYIVPEAPAWRTEDVYWKDLDYLLARVRDVTRLRTPKGPLVVVGHSGAYRTIQSWLDYDSLDYLIMLDAMYGPTDPYEQWLTEGPRHELKHLIMVTLETEVRALQMVRKYASLAVKRKDLPKTPAGFSSRQRTARILQMHSDRYDHMEIITKGEVMPLVLRLVPLERL